MLRWASFCASNIRHSVDYFDADSESDKLLFEITPMLVLEHGTPDYQRCLPSIIMTTAGRYVLIGPSTVAHLDR